jgi:hypothetical protein
MKRWIVLAVVMAALVSIPTAVLASTGSTGSAGSPVNLQQGVWRVGNLSTMSTSFQPVAGLSAKICALGEVSATVSLVGAGAPMGVLIQVGGVVPMEPGAMRFAPQGTADSTSFTFVWNAQPDEGYDNHIFDLEWRSPSGARSTLQRATMNLVYQKGTHLCP